MPSLDTFKSDSIKMLLCGKPGAGKTGSLVSILADDPEARLFIANFDRGNIGTLANVARIDPATKLPRPNTASILSRIHYHDMQDTVGSINGVPMVLGTPKAFAELGKRLNKWEEDGSLGGLNTWGPKDWLVIDSISALGESAMRYATNAGGRLNRRPEQGDWGEAIARMQLIFESINDTSVKANVCCVTHIRYVGDMESGVDDKGKPKELDAVPNAIGQKLPQEIGRYFNNIIEVRVMGEGPGSTRKIFTRSPGQLVLRTSNPGAVKPDYPIGSGMAELVRDLRSSGPAPTSPVPTTPVAAKPALPQPATSTPAPASK